MSARPIQRAAPWYAYDAVGNLQQYIDRNGAVRSFTYDAANRQIAETWLDHGLGIRTIQYIYDPAGNLTSAADPDSVYSFRYDADNRLTEADNVGTPRAPHLLLTYGYDAVGNATSVRDNRGVSVTSAYDPRNLLISRGWQGAEVDTAASNSATTPAANGPKSAASPRRWARPGGPQRVRLRSPRPLDGTDPPRCPGRRAGGL